MPADRHLTLVPGLIANFRSFLTEFEEHPPFTRPEQLDLHRKTIELRRNSGAVADAIANPEFVESLHRTLRAWGLGSRGSKLRQLADFSSALAEALPDIVSLEGLRIDDPTPDVGRTTRTLWRLIETLNVADNAAPVVSGTKTLHHILPDLVPPMDRAYTQAFFLWHNPQFQYGQSECFRKAFLAFVDIAHQVNPQQYVGDHPWHTSRTKVLDNAVVGCVQAILMTAREAEEGEETTE